MPAIKSRNWVLKLGTAGAGGTVAGIQNANMKINNEEVDITTKDSLGWRELGEAFGTQSVDLDIDGILSNSATYETLQSYAQLQTINGFQFISIDAADTDAISGLFLVTGFTVSTGTGGEIKFACSLKSSGAITFTNT